MTLFETDAPVELLSACREAHLPAPSEPRFVPLRAGIVNVWEYDDQQFWFADGRLLLRGRNEAGKSKVLELLFPFVLDGDVSPKKLDPFDTANKSMWWNLIGFSKADRAAAIGYLWIEFGRIDDDGTAEFLTAIVGLQSTRAERKVNTWFALTPQRIDVHLDLAPDDKPLTQDAFSRALSNEARFETKAGVHRANVASRLFFMAPDRFDNLLHLLRQLRKPKLAVKLDAAKLSEVLTNALPPLDDEKIKPLADGFRLLDGDIADLDNAEKALRATKDFLDVYRTYARSHVRHRAGQVRSANTTFDNVTKAEAGALGSLEHARNTSIRLKKQLQAIALELANASGSLAALDLSAVESLGALEMQATADRVLAETINAEATRARKDATEASDAAVAATERLEEQLAAQAQVLHTARRAATRAGLDETWEDAGGDTARSAQQLLAASRGRRALVDAVAAAERRAAKAREQLVVAEAAVTEAADRAAATADAESEAARAADEARTAVAGDVDSWLRAAPQVIDADVDTVLAALEEALPRGQRATRGVADAYTARVLSSVDAGVEVASATRTEARNHHRHATQALRDHDDQPDVTPPPLRPGVPAARAGVPLWRTVQFTEAVSNDDAAFLEAALDAAGLLDAIVTADGLHRDVDDTVVVATGAAAAKNLSAWLRPADDADAEVVAAALASVGVGADSGAVCWVDLDGTWGNGPLRGRWTKVAPEHIGAAARAAARGRKRAELVEVLEAARGAAEAAEAAYTAAEDARRVARQWTNDFPPVDAWATAVTTVARTAAEAARAAVAHTKAQAAHARVLEANRAAFDGVTLAITAAKCQPDDVDSTRERLTAADQAASDLRDAAREVTAAAEAATARRANADRLDATATDAEARHARANLAAAESESTYRTKRELEGADVERVLAEKERLEGAVNELTTRQRTTDESRQTAREAEIRAEAVLEETGRRREAATEERDRALAGLAAMVRSGHVSHAVVVDLDRDPADYTQPTAGRTLARQIAVAVPESEGRDDERNRSMDQLVTAYTPLRTAIGTSYDPQLESGDDGVFVATATLNGEVITIAALHKALGVDVEQRRQAIAAEERNLIEQYLRDQVGDHLGDCLHAATREVQAMNAILKRHPTNSGATIQLRWQVSEAAGANVRSAAQALLTSPSTRVAQESADLAVFLAERVAMARRGEVDGADLAERLTAALDYRTWYRFGITYRTQGDDADLTAKTVGAGSGGQQAKVAHLPLLAAAAGFYSSSPSAPRLCFLDEAFAGIDGPNTADLLAVTRTLDLDMVMTNFDAWFCVPQLPGLAIYHLEKVVGGVGVAAIRYEWDGHVQQESDPWLTQ
jgi:uncharacterized protein (TIGR02680 family)